MKVTEENLKIYEDKILEYKNIEGPLLPILNIAQDMFGYIPKETHKIIHDNFKISLAHINSVITFYELYDTFPTGKHKISVCTGTTCHMLGSDKILKEIKNILNIDEGETSKDNKFTLIPYKCFGKCDMSPNMMIDDKIYESVNVKDIPNILKKYK